VQCQWEEGEPAEGSGLLMFGGGFEGCLLKVGGGLEMGLGG
jgi:hypothetical protein